MSLLLLEEVGPKPLVLGRTSSYWLEAVAVVGTVRPMAVVDTVFEAVVKVVAGWVQPMAALETVMEAMGLQSCPPMHLHRPQHYEALGNQELD
jgi:hypothetical protein